MSKSKRAAQGSASSAPRQGKNLWKNENGAVRTGWLLAACLAAYALVVLAARCGLMRAFDALFGVWGITAANAHRAPAWARVLYRWHGSLVTLIFAGLSLWLCRRLRRLWRLEGRALTPVTGALWRSVAAGACAALFIALLCLVPDSMRLSWPLNRPHMNWTMPLLCLVSLIFALGEEAFTKRVLYDGLNSRWRPLWARVLTCASYWVIAGGVRSGVVGSVNVLLLGWVCCLLYERHGLWASTGFRWGWSAVIAFLLGFGGGDAALYRLYGVSETLMTGGDGGPMAGLWATLLLAGLIAWFEIRRKANDCRCHPADVVDPENVRFS